MNRLTEAACMALVAWPVYAVVIVLDKTAGWVIDARNCRFANLTHLPLRGDDD